MLSAIFKGKIQIGFNPTIYFDSRHMDFKNIFDPSSYSNHVVSNILLSFENDEVDNHVSYDNIIAFYISLDHPGIPYLITNYGKDFKCHSSTKNSENYTSDQPHISVPDYLSEIWSNIVKNDVASQEIYNVDNFALIPLEIEMQPDIFSGIDFAIFYGDLIEVFKKVIDIGKVFSYGVKDIVYIFYCALKDGKFFYLRIKRDSQRLTKKAVS